MPDENIVTNPDPQAPASVEFLSRGSGGIEGSGYLTSRLMQSGGNVARFASSLRTADLLKKDEWKRMDDTVIGVARESLVITQRLIGRGLTYDLPNALGVMQLDQERMGDMGPASVQMTALVREETDRIDFDMTSLPIPIIHKGFNLNIRHLLASRNGSTPLDTTQAAIASRKVSEKIEDIIINGEQGLHFGASGLNIPGMMNAPDSLGKGGTDADADTGNATTVTLGDARTGSVVYTGWLNAAASPSAANNKTSVASSIVAQDLFNDLIAQVALLNQLNYFGPFTLYVPRSFWYQVLQDWSASKGDNSILDRIRQIPDIGEIVTVPALPPDKTVLIQETQDVVDIVTGIQPTTVTWSPDPGFVTHFMIMAIIVPRFKSTKAKQTGVLIGTRQF